MAHAGVSVRIFHVLPEVAGPACVTFYRHGVDCWRLLVLVHPGWDELQMDTGWWRCKAWHASRCLQASMAWLHEGSSDMCRESRYHWREENKPYSLKAGREHTGGEETIARGLEQPDRKDFGEHALQH